MSNFENGCFEVVRFELWVTKDFTFSTRWSWLVHSYSRYKSNLKSCGTSCNFVDGNEECCRMHCFGSYHITNFFNSSVIFGTFLWM